MAATMLNQGVYDLVEAGRLLGSSATHLLTWANPSAQGLDPVVRPSFDRAFSFIDLVSLRVALELDGQGVPDGDLRRGITHLREYFDVDRPLATEHVIARIATSGSAFLADLSSGSDSVATPGYVDIGKGRQGVFQDVVRLYLRKVHFGEEGKPDTWAPADSVLLDPRIQAGAPCVSGTRIPTATIAELLADESVEEVATEFGLSVVQVRDAADFQQHLDSGHPIAA